MAARVAGRVALREVRRAAPGAAGACVALRVRNNGGLVEVGSLDLAAHAAPASAAGSGAAAAAREAGVDHELEAVDGRAGGGGRAQWDGGP